MVSFNPERLLPGKTAPDTHSVGGWMGSRAGLDAMARFEDRTESNEHIYRIRKRRYTYRNK